MFPFHRMFLLTKRGASIIEALGKGGKLLCIAMFVHMKVKRHQQLVCVSCAVCIFVKTT
jgi:uncharacterized membrane protein